MMEIVAKTTITPGQEHTKTRQMKISDISRYLGL